MNKSTINYWNQIWNNTNIRSVSPKSNIFSNHVNYQFHLFFKKLFNNIDTKNKRILELGCANSIWLPYFHKEYGFEVYGIDYSPNGCESARKMLSINEANGTVINCDFFNPPEELFEKFDYVFSMGVVEHFDDTKDCINKFSKFLKNDGIIITSIPNMVGIIGLFTKLFNKAVYDIHQLLDLNLLKQAHMDSDLSIITSSYFLFSNFGVLNLEGLNKSFNYWIKKLLFVALARVSMLTWVFENHLTPNKHLAPYIVCIAKKH